MIASRALAALFVLTTGCSIVTTTGAPDHPAPSPSPPDCTTSKVPVYVDGVVSMGAMATSLFLGLGALANSDRRTELGYATLFTFLGSIPFAISGIVGGVRVESCREAHEQWRAMQQPRPYGPYPQPYAPYPSPYPAPPAP